MRTRHARQIREGITAANRNQPPPRSRISHRAWRRRNLTHMKRAVAFAQRVTDRDIRLAQLIATLKETP